MASAEQHRTTEAPPRLPEADTRRMIIVLIAAAVIALVAGAVFSGVFGSGIEQGGGLRRFFLSYLTAFGFALSIVLGALFFVMLQHVTRAGWSVAVRRVPEALANSVPVLAILSIPILATFLFPGNGGSPTLYPWAAHHDDSAANGVASNDQISPAEASELPAQEQSDETASGRVPFSAQETSLPDSPLLTRETLTAGYAREHLEYTPLTRHKARWLNPLFFTLRIVLYFTVWIVIAGFYWRNSVLQDASGDPALTSRMQKLAPLCLLAYAATVTGAAFDLWMSIDPHFFSTIFAGYIFAGAVIGSLSVIILVYHALCSRGMLHESINREHFHDLGKLLFAFVFFWGYIAFSQFMLIWYANIPETTYWFGVRGATTVDANFAFGDWPAAAEAPAPVGWWSIIILTLLVAHLLIPFAGLLSRHVKRNRTALVFWSVWMLVMHYLDHYWLIMPEAMVGGWRVWPLPELFMLLFMVGAVGGYFLWTLSGVALRPAADPRLHESLAFHNI